MKLKTGDILLVKGKGWIGKVISLFTKSEYTHSACYIKKSTVIESYWGGVKLVNIKTEGKYDVFRHETATPYQLRKVTEWMITQVGRGYDYLGLFGIGFSMLGITKKNHLDGKNEYWCSELVADAYLHAHIPLDVEEDTWKVSPADFSRSHYFKQIRK